MGLRAFGSSSSRLSMRYEKQAIRFTDECGAGFRRDSIEVDKWAATILDEMGLDPRSVPDTERWEAKSPRRNARAPVSEPRGDALAERGPRSSKVHHTARSSANAFSISICKLK